jgi:DNA (cytosine-5)-methyltransferase 1
MNGKYNVIDLFAGCGGMTEGFIKTNKYNEVAAVEWLKPQVDTLRNRLASKWGVQDADDRVIHFDIQKNGQLFTPFLGDLEYQPHCGLDTLVDKSGCVDLIIGGPPCQAYSLAGRIKDERGMQDDYRNYLFEHYLNIVEKYQPKAFVFENVPGLLSANVKGEFILDLIKMGFNNIGYDIISDVRKNALLDVSEYGIPQNRKRVILFGIKKSMYQDTQSKLCEFYNIILPQYKKNKTTVRESIGDLPNFTPLFDDESHKKRMAYIDPKCKISWHTARYHNKRDMETFKLLAEDLESENPIYTDAKKLCQLYKDRVGAKSQSGIHRYHVLAPDQPSTTIVAHLYKDGLRYIHYDPKQARSITVREAARLQSFDDDFEFIGSQTHAYQMIGNAVPPKFAECLALAVYDFLEKYK